MASLYLHIPFCERKCLYCDFYSVENMGSMEKFLTALHHEIDLYRELARGETFETIYFGGGTPSLLTVPQLDSILTHLRGTYALLPGAEVTLEANPGTVTEQNLAGYQSLGVNRLSIGVQSFHDHELKFLSRIHTAVEALRCVHLARAAGFQNLSIDLIFALPGQTKEAWEDNLATAISLSPEHISAYSLIVEDHTPLSRMVRAGDIAPAPLETEAELYEVTMNVLSARGYEQYEVSNFARPGFRSRHNGNYWHHRPYLGLGPSAHSFWPAGGPGSSRRWWNVANISSYTDRLSNGAPAVASEERIGSKELLNERIFLGLRSDGLDLGGIRAEFALDLSPSGNETVRRLVDESLAVIDGEVLRLTPKGYLICDEVAGHLMI